MIAITKNARTARRDAKREAMRVENEAYHAQICAEARAKIEAMTLRTELAAPVKKTEELLTRHVFDLGAFDELAQVVTESHGYPTVSRVVALPSKRLARLVGGNYQWDDAKENVVSGWSRTVFMDDGTDGPALDIVDGRMEVTITYGHGSAHCATVDRLRAMLDPTTGRPRVEAEATSEGADAA